METIEDFFVKENTVCNISEEDYRKMELLVDATKIFAKNTHQCIYIIDFFKHNFLYVSDNVSFWCDQNADEVKKLGYQFYLNCIPENEHKMLLEIYRRGVEFFKDIPGQCRPDYTISCNFHITDGYRKRLVTHHFTPMVLTKEGNVWLALCAFSLATRKIPGNMTVKKASAKSYYEYSFVTKEWDEKEITPLKEMDKEILFLSAQGYTNVEIADKLCRSVDTIKGYKKSLFSRLGVKNITEALSLAINYRFSYNIHDTKKTPTQEK